MSETMPNLDFSIEERPIMDDACYYCDAPIRERHVRISFESNPRKIRLHLDPCWDTFVDGVNIIDNMLKVRNKN